MTSIRDATKKFAVGVLNRWFEVKAGAGQAYSPGYPTVAGFFRTPSGLGESARQIVGALRVLAKEPSHFDLSPRFAPGDLLEPFGNLGEPFGNLGEPFSGQGPAIIHVNPPELSAVTAYIGKRALRDRYIVGHWSWELETVPRSWLRGFDFVHEVWVPSNFCATAVSMATNKHVRVVPTPIQVGEFASSPDSVVDSEKGFVALVMFDIRSSVARKNPIGAVHAFKRAFGDRTDRSLVIKISGGSSTHPALDELHRAIGGAPNIEMRSEPLHRRELLALISRSDVLISLYRAEGYGLSLLESMLLGTPVLATNWSGPTDYLDQTVAALVPARLVSVDDPQNIYADKGLRWAEPDIDVATELLRRMADEKTYRTALAERGMERAQLVTNAEYFWTRTGSIFQSLTP